MKTPLTVLLLALMAILTTTFCNSVPEEKGLKEAMEGKFYMGAAMNEKMILGEDKASLEILHKHFNSVVTENCMKMERIHPEEGIYDFTLADKFIEFAQEHDLYTVGHCLVWHSQCPPWFFRDAEGNEVSRELLIQRLKEHISTVAGRYKGKIDAWDVVNEAFEDDGSWRETPFYRIIGEEYMELVFTFAHEADPDATLLYNDYSMYHQGRREAVLKLTKSFREKGVAIHGVGLQAHWGMDYPGLNALEKNILAYAGADLEVHFTEMDITVLPSPWNNTGAEISNKAEYQEKMNPYAEGLPEEVEQALNQRWLDFFEIFLKHQDKIVRVTTWGISDLHSWKNDWPIRGRTNYPLMFDREFQAKPAVGEIIKAAAQ